MMNNSKPEQKERERTIIKPLMIVSGLLLLLGIIFLISNKVQSHDPTLTAAPQTGQPGQIYGPSPEKQARIGAMRAKADAEAASFRAANGLPSPPSSAVGGYSGNAAPVANPTH